MASSEYDGGIGGKFRRRPFRKAPATPYDRPQTAIRRTNPNPNPNPVGSNLGWISKVVDPASRIIARGASKFFASVFQKRLTAPPAQPPQTEENLLSSHRAPEAVCNNLQAQKPLNKALEQSVNSGKNVTNLSDIDGTQQEMISGTEGLFELEQILKQKTFTREEFDRLTELLRSRTVEPSTSKLGVDHENNEHAIVTEQLQHHEQLIIEPSTSHTVVNFKRNEKVIVSEQEDRTRSSSLHENTIDPACNLHIPKEVAVSPAEIAKAYIGSKPSEAAPSALSLQSWIPQDDATLPNETYVKKPFTPFLASRPYVNSSCLVKHSENGYTTPRPYGRSALYKMSRSPYFNVHHATNIRGGRPVRDDLASSPTSSLVPPKFLLSSGKQALKRGSSVLDCDTGSFGPIRRIRQKSDLMSPASGRHSPSRNLPSSLTTLPNQDVNRRSASSNHKSNAGVTPQSTEMANKIFQELGKLVASPREKLYEKTEKKGSDNLEGASDSLLPSLRNSISPKQDRIIDNSPSENAVSAIKAKYEAVDMKIPVTSSTNVGREIMDAAISDSVAISSQKEPTFQRTTFEESGANKHNVGSTSGLLTTGSDKMLQKSLAYPPKSIPALNSMLKGEADVKALDRSANSGGVAFTFSPATVGSQTSPQPHVPPPLVDRSIVTKEISFPASKSVSEGLWTTTAICEPAGLKVDASISSMASIRESPGLDKEDVANFSNTGSSANSCSPSVSTAAPPLLASNPLFHFGSGSSTGAPISVSLSRNTSDAGDSDKKSVKTLADPVSSSIAPGMLNAFSSTSRTSAAPSTSSMFSSIGDSTSSPATSSLFLNTASGSSSLAASASVSSPMNGNFGLSASGNPSTSSLSFAKNNFSNSGSHFGGTTGSIFGAQPTLSVSGTKSFPGSSAVQCGSVSSEPTFGLNVSSSLSSGTTPFQAATPGGKSFSLLTGLSSSVGSSGSASIPSFAPTASNSLFSSSSQPSSMSMLASPLGSNPSLPSAGFSSGPTASASSKLTSPVGASSGSVFPFCSVGTSASSASPSPAQPVFSIPTQSAGFSSGSLGNDQMNVEDAMVDDNIQAAAPSVPSFGEPANLLSTPNFHFGTPAAPSGSPLVTVPQDPPPLQTAGSFEFSAGGSFSLGSSGGDKSGRRIVRVKRNRHIKK